MSAALPHEPNPGHIHPNQASSHRIALIDSKGVIIGINNNWSEFAARNGATMSRVGRGVNYLEVCRGALSSCDDAREALSGIEAVLERKLSSFVMDYSAQTGSSEACYRMVVTPFWHADARAAIMHIDITQSLACREETLDRTREAARRIIHAQEQERERIARELHDDLGHRIALLSFSVHELRSRHRAEDLAGRDIDDVLHKVEDMSAALRHVTQGLHPPLLEHSGIAAAIQALCDELIALGAVRIQLALPDQLRIIPAEVELCLFRMTQESLNNIVKHSGASSATVQLEYLPKAVRLTISDDGSGFVQRVALQKGGLGLNGMRERVLCLNGRLEVRSEPGAGSRIRATIPLHYSTN